MEDPKIIRTNIRHHQKLLKLCSAGEKHNQVLKLLGKVQTHLPPTIAKTLDHTRQQHQTDPRTAGSVRSPARSVRVVLQERAVRPR